MKKVDLLKQLRQIAKRKGLMLKLRRKGAKHEVWSLGNTTLTIPRHREIARFTAEGIINDAEKEQPCR